MAAKRQLPPSPPGSQVASPSALLPNEGLNMAGFILVLGLFTLPSALPEFTVSPANLVTARTTSAPATPQDAFKKSREEFGLWSCLQKTEYTVNATSGGIVCKTGLLSNCKLLEIFRDDHVYMDHKHLRMANHLQEQEEQVLESLGQLKEVCGALLSRPSGQLELAVSARRCTTSLATSPRRST